MFPAGQDIGSRASPTVYTDVPPCKRRRMDSDTDKTLAELSVATPGSTADERVHTIVNTEPDEQQPSTSTYQRASTMVIYYGKHQEKYRTNQTTTQTTSHQ